MRKIYKNSHYFLTLIFIATLCPFSAKGAHGKGAFFDKPLKLEPCSSLDFSAPPPSQNGGASQKLYNILGKGLKDAAQGVGRGFLRGAKAVQEWWQSRDSQDKNSFEAYAMNHDDHWGEDPQSPAPYESLENAGDNDGQGPVFQEKKGGDVYKNATSENFFNTSVSLQRSEKTAQDSSHQGKDIDGDFLKHIELVVEKAVHGALEKNVEGKKASQEPNNKSAGGPEKAQLSSQEILESPLGHNEGTSKGGKIEAQFKNPAAYDDLKERPLVFPTDISHGNPFHSNASVNGLGPYRGQHYNNFNGCAGNCYVEHFPQIGYTNPMGAPYGLSGHGPRTFSPIPYSYFPYAGPYSYGPQSVFFNSALALPLSSNEALNKRSETQKTVESSDITRSAESEKIEDIRLLQELLSEVSLCLKDSKNSKNKLKNRSTRSKKITKK